MFNKDNVFITVNEEVSSITQQYIIREIKKILDKYKSITTEEIISVEKLINSISNKELKEEFLNDWSMSVKIAKEIGENEVDDRIISMYQNLKGNGLEELSIGHVINWCNELDEQGYVMIDDYSIIYKSSANLKDVARRLLDELLDDAIYVDSLIDKDSLVEYWIEQTSRENVIDDLIRGSNIEELLGLAPENIYEDEYNKYLYSEIEC
ncbi:hypothetical protein HCG75_14820 [Clostridium sp. K12(2020)]|uniref:hypothetical protein n=1 Tax=Clostridium sp. K12(2020) TaxID=2718936 RepID=UPI001C8CE090|nr:hypothetical protein [Clostridium sp. K12(2020)]MBX9138658.1 hypothetical protein [Clostridium sp. K12(2020)]